MFSTKDDQLRNARCNVHFGNPCYREHIPFFMYRFAVSIDLMVQYYRFRNNNTRRN